MMKKILPLVAFLVLLAPSVFADTLFSDDFSGDLSQWNITRGSFVIEDGYMKSNVSGSEVEAFSLETFYVTDFELTYKVYGNDSDADPDLYFETVQPFLNLYVSDSYILLTDVIFGGYPPPSGRRFEVKQWLGYTNPLHYDQNYSYIPIGDWYYIKLSINGSGIKAKVWNESDSEPDWMWEGTHSISLEDGFRIMLVEPGLYETESVGFDDILLTTPTPPTPPPESPLAPLGAFAGLAALLVAAGWVLFAMRSFYTAKITPQAMVGLLITLVITLVIVAWLIMG
jgi:hypothetical protein